ncbi:MAG: class I SAM-dependent methyltransferase [bacterium]|nr:class I SAM-dependent methyltransferase [bacterium]
MTKSDCLCSNKTTYFTPIIIYKNETTFKEYNGIVIGKCQSCGLLKTIKQTKSFNPKQSRFEMYEQKKDLFISLFNPIIDKIIKFKKKGKILDVGCSSGILLELLKKKNFDIYGVEPNKNAFKISYKKFKNKIYNGTLIDLSNKKGKSYKQFDVIIYNHVLEHIADVHNELQCINLYLKENGIIIIGVPNTQNIIFFLRQKYWELLMPKEHVWHFSQKNLKSIIKKNNYNILDISFSNDNRQDYSLLKRVYFLFLSLINTLFNTGESMLLVCKRK